MDIDHGFEMSNQGDTGGQLGRAHMSFSCACAGVEGGRFVIGRLSLQQGIEVELHREVGPG